MSGSHGSTHACVCTYSPPPWAWRDIRSLHAYTYAMTEIARIVETMHRGCPATQLRQASRMLARMYDAAFRPLGLELSQVPVVATVAARGDAGIRIGEL